MISSIARLLALYDCGVIEEADVVAWADRAIAAHSDPSPPPQWLLDLSISGVDKNRSGAECELPPPESFSYAEEFALRATSLDIASDRDVLRFCRWVASASSCGDLDDPLVRFGYMVDDLLEFDEVEAVTWARAELDEHVPGLRARAEALRELPPIDND